MGTTVVNGVTFVNVSGPVRFADIAAAFGNDVNQASELRNRRWYKSDYTRGNFPSSGNLSLSQLRGTGGNVPRVDRNQYPANGIFYGSGPISIPKFNTLTIRVFAGGGGGGGGNAAHVGGIFNGVPIVGGAGTAGGTVSVTIAPGTIAATGGGGGNNGANGANGLPTTTAASAPGGAGNGNGGLGGFAEYTINADNDYATAVQLYDQSYTPSYGAPGSGAGGAGALGLVWNGVQYLFSGVNGAAGGNGVPGGVSVIIDLGLY